jgi:hypothetical protein
VSVQGEDRARELGIFPVALPSPPEVCRITSKLEALLDTSTVALLSQGARHRPLRRACMSG